MAMRNAVNLMSMNKHLDDGHGDDREAARRKRMLERVYAALESKMREIEERTDRGRDSDTGSVASAADSERDVRTLNTLTRLLEKITILSATPGEVEGATDTDREAEAADAERLREEIAERIARLRQCETI